MVVEGPSIHKILCLFAKSVKCQKSGFLSNFFFSGPDDVRRYFERSGEGKQVATCPSSDTASFSHFLATCVKCQKSGFLSNFFFSGPDDVRRYFERSGEGKQVATCPSSDTASFSHILATSVKCQKSGFLSNFYFSWQLA